MIKRYVSTDIPDIRAFLLPEPDKYIQFHTGMQAVDMLYFDIWLSRARDGRVTAVLFRSYGDFCLRVAPGADLEELTGFIRFLPMLTTLSCDAALAWHLLPHLDQVRAVTPCAVAVQSAPGPALPFELDYRRAGGVEDFRQVFDLLGAAGNREIARFEDYYYLRRNREKSWTGRTYLLAHEDRPYATVSTAGECPGMALVADVATHPDYRRQGLASALLTVLCGELHKVGKIPYVSYEAGGVANFYRRLGFQELYPFLRLQIERPPVPMRSLF